MNAALSRRRLDWLIRARGTDVAAWPAPERDAALALLRRSPEAQAALAEALAQEDAPDLGGDADADPDAISRMQAALRCRIAPLPVALRGLGAALLAGCVAAGLFLAATAPTDNDGADVLDRAQLISVAALDQ